MSSLTKYGLIKRLQAEAPRGKPIGSDQLKDLSISPELAYRYVCSGWLTKLGRGVFMFAGDELQRDACIQFLSNGISGFHVGGKTALAWWGIRHNISSQEKLSLWGPKNFKLPNWFKARFSCTYTARNLFDLNIDPYLGLKTPPESNHDFLVSVPERALLEMLSDVGLQQEVEEAREIMSGMTSVRKELLKTFLTHCAQVKTVRLCINWTKDLGLSWVKTVDEATPKAGKGRWIKKLKNGTTLTLNPL